MIVKTTKSGRICIALDNSEFECLLLELLKFIEAIPTTIKIKSILDVHKRCAEFNLHEFIQRQNWNPHFSQIKKITIKRSEAFSIVMAIALSDNPQLISLKSQILKAI
jgi:hypothetical protein